MLFLLKIKNVPFIVGDADRVMTSNGVENQEAFGDISGGNSPGSEPNSLMVRATSN